MSRAYHVTVKHVGIFPHERDARGRLFFPRCESTKTDCQARPDHVAIARWTNPRNRTTTARLCRHHAEELSDADIA